MRIDIYHIYIYRMINFYSGQNKKEVRLNAKQLKNTNDKPKVYMLHTSKAFWGNLASEKENFGGSSRQSRRE